MKPRKPTTDRFRYAFVSMWIMTLAVGLIGWLAGASMDGFVFLATMATGGVGIGEGSNIGKRATMKVDVIEAMRAAPDELEEYKNGGGDGYVRPPDLELDPPEGNEG